MASKVKLRPVMLTSHTGVLVANCFFLAQYGGVSEEGEGRMLGVEPLWGLGEERLRDWFKAIQVGSWRAAQEGWFL